MIKVTTLYSVVCDVCQSTFEDSGCTATEDPTYMAELAVCHGWLILTVREPQECYCSNCYHVDSRGKLTIKPRVDKNALST